MSKNAKKWEVWEDNLILTSKVPTKTLMEVLNRSYDAISTRKTLLKRRYFMEQEERERNIENFFRNQARSLEVQEELERRTAGLNFSPQCRNILQLAIKDSLNIDLLLNPEYKAAQLKELYFCLKAGVDISFATPDYNEKQITEIRLGRQHSIDTSAYEDPNYCFEAMRQIRYGLEAGLSVDVYASHDYHYAKMHILRDCLRNRIPTKVIANPAYSVLRMKIMRSAVKAGLDTTTFEDPNIPDTEAKRIFQDLYAKFRAIYPVLSKIPKREHFSLDNLHDAGEPFVVHCNIHSLAVEFLNEMKNLGYSWDKIVAKKPNSLGGLCFYCNPKEKTLYANQNKPKGDCFVSYASIKENDSPLRKDNWIPYDQAPPRKRGMYLCLVKDKESGEVKERFLEYEPGERLNRRFRVDGTVLSWKPHFTREELSSRKKSYPDEDVFPAQTFFAMR